MTREENLTDGKGIPQLNHHQFPNCPNWFPPNAYTSLLVDVHTVCYSLVTTPFI